MKFEALEARLRRLEVAHDRVVPPGVHVVVRLDGRNFTRLTKETLPLEAPFDTRFRDAMLATAEHLMTCGPDVVYAYSQSDEVSLLLAHDDATFGRKVRKLVSILAGEASAHCSLALQHSAVFDARVCELPKAEDVADYFRWRQADARRNALNAHCYWALRDDGLTGRAATKQLNALAGPEKLTLLREQGVDFEQAPAWQQRGVGLYWQTYTKQAADPRSGLPVEAQRRRIQRELVLPEGDAYTAFLLALLASVGASAGAR